MQDIHYEVHVYNELIFENMWPYGNFIIENFVAISCVDTSRVLVKGTFVAIPVHVSLPKIY